MDFGKEQIEQVGMRLHYRMRNEQWSRHVKVSYSQPPTSTKRWWTTHKYLITAIPRFFIAFTLCLELSWYWVFEVNLLCSNIHFRKSKPVHHLYHVYQREHYTTTYVQSPPSTLRGNCKKTTIRISGIWKGTSGCVAKFHIVILRLTTGTWTFKTKFCRPMQVSDLLRS
jgi:hypothetical protein